MGIIKKPFFAKIRKEKKLYRPLTPEQSSGECARSGLTLRPDFRGLFVALTAAFAVATPAVAGSLLDSANGLYNAGKLSEAISIYGEAAQSGENRTLCYFNMGNACFRMDSIAQSIVWYRAASDEAPDFFRAHLNLAIAFHSLDDMGNCIASVSRALELEPRDTKAMLIAAAAYRRAGALPEAICAFEQLVAEDAGSHDALIALGEMYRELDDFEAARRWLDLYPDSGANAGYALNLLAEMYEQEGRIDKTIHCLQRLRHINPDESRLALRICLLHEMAGRRLVAFEEAKAALTLFANDGDLALFAGNCAFSLGHWAEAEYYYGIAKARGLPGAIVGLENVRMAKSGNDR